MPVVSSRASAFVDALRRRFPVPGVGSVHERVLDEQLRMVWAHAMVATVIAAVFAVVLALQLRGAAASNAAIDVWLAVKLVVAAMRFTQGIRYLRQGQPGGRRWRLETALLLAVDGAVWGAAGVLLMSGPIPLASLIGAVLACVACVATFGLQVSLLATAAYVLPILAPTAVSLLVRGDDFGWVGGSGMVLLLALQLVTASRSQWRIVEGIQLRMRAEQLAAEKDDALKLALRQSAVKTQFLANISHELRTPLHGILGVARLLHLEAFDTAVVRRVELIEASGTHLLGLINDLLDISRVESGRVVLNEQPFDLIEQVENLAAVYAVRSEDRGIAFSLDIGLAGPYRVTGDPARLRQVLHNLLGNAIKFTRRGSIGLTLTPEGDDMIRIRVVDTGRGMAPEDLGHVFEAFRQLADGSTKPLEGAGLGLTIARELARAMGGDITAQSTLGAGTQMVFTARLPRAVEAAAATPSIAARPATDRRAGHYQVLVAEDEDVNALIATAYLEHYGFLVERVRDGKEAVRHALREVNRPDVVLMDCRMPEMDGYEATRKIRAQELTLGLARVPVIALTATAGDAERRECIDAGMDDFLPKPYTKEQLAQAIDAWVSPRRAVAAG